MTTVQLILAVAGTIATALVTCGTGFVRFLRWAVEQWRLERQADRDERRAERAEDRETIRENTRAVATLTTRVEDLDDKIKDRFDEISGVHEVPRQRPPAKKDRLRTSPGGYQIVRPFDEET